MVQVGRVIAVAAIGVVVLVALGYVAFVLSFGAADYAEYSISAERIPQDQIPGDATTSLTAAEEAVVSEAIVNGSAQSEATRLDLDGAYVTNNGTYYRVNLADTDSVERERFVVKFQQVNASSASIREVDSLPSVDQQRIKEAYRDIERDDGREVLSYPYREMSEANDSVLLNGNVSHVQMQNVTLRVIISRQKVNLTAYRYTTSHVASNESAFVQSLVHDVNEALSDGETEPIQTAINEDQFSSRAGDFESAWEPVQPIAAMCGIDVESFLNRDDTATCYIRFEGSHYRLTFDGHDTFV